MTKTSSKIKSQSHEKASKKTLVNHGQSSIVGQSHSPTRTRRQPEQQRAIIQLYQAQQQWSILQLHKTKQQRTVIQLLICSELLKYAGGRLLTPDYC